MKSPENRATHRKWLFLQKKMYRALDQEVQSVLGTPPDAIRRYARELRRDLHTGRLHRVERAEIIKAVEASDVTLVGDFHSFDQAQRTALRLLRELSSSKRKGYLGLEFIPSQFQAELDQYVSGKLGLDRFLSLIHYDESWGFPWKNYSPLLEFAKRNRIKPIALNLPEAALFSKKMSDLQERDRWAAGIITDLFMEERKKGVDPRMVVLYGELHLASAHLPARLKEVSKKNLGKGALKLVVLHQNDAELYWRLAKRELAPRAEAVWIRKQEYCLFTSPPWMKLQSLVRFVESSAVHESEMGFHDHSGDPLAVLHTHAVQLSELIGLQSPDAGNLHLYGLKEESKVKRLILAAKKRGELSSQAAKIADFHLRIDQKAWIPHLRIAYIPALSENALLEMAALILVSDAKKETTGHFDFEQATLEACFTFLATLLINPRRKCDLPADHRKRIKLLKAREETSSFPGEADSRSLFLREFRRLFGRGKNSKPQIKGEGLQVQFSASQYLGQCLAKILQTQGGLSYEADFRELLQGVEESARSREALIGITNRASSRSAKKLLELKKSDYF